MAKKKATNEKPAVDKGKETDLVAVEEENEIVPIEKTLIQNIMDNTDVVGIMTMLMKTVIPDLTNGIVEIKSVDKNDKGETKIEIHTHTSPEYDIKAHVLLKGGWYVSLKFINLETNRVRTFEYSEESR